MYLPKHFSQSEESKVKKLIEQNGFVTILSYPKNEKPYITPRWYKSGRDVPTWNYAVAHLHGKIDLVEEFQSQIEVLNQLSNFYEKPSPKPWEFELPDDLNNELALTSAIISFKFKIEKVEAKFKLSQNRPPEDKAGVIEGLLERKDDMSRSVREMMIENE